MSSHPLARLLIGCFSVVLISVPCSGQKFDSLLKKVPKSANTLVAMDAEALLKTPLAAKEGWAKKFEAEFVDRTLFIPPEAKQIVVAGYIDPVRGFQREWELALVSLSEPLTMRSIAMSEGGYVDTIKGVPAAWAPSNVYFLETGVNELGVIFPAERQRAARWIDFASQSTTVQTTPYLRQVASGVSSETQIVLGIDLTDVVQPHRLDQRIKEGGLDLAGVKPEQFIAMMTGLKGMKMQISVSDTVSAVATVEFSGPISLSPTVAKSLVLDALKEFGATVSAIEDWKADVTSSAIHLSGKLDKESLRRVLSLVELPSTKFSSLSDADVENSGEEEIVKTSKAYFGSITAYLKGLRPKTIGNSQGGGDGVWMERYARKIDGLPILHVDKDLLEYGSKLSDTLRYMSGARKRSGVAGGVAAANIGASGGGGYSGYGYDYNGSGYGGFQGSATGNIARADNAVTAQKRGYQAQATNVRIEGWSLIDAATRDIRTQMTERYDTEF
jgi:hypothetical protein